MLKYKAVQKYKMICGDENKCQPLTEDELNIIDKSIYDYDIFNKAIESVSNEKKLKECVESRKEAQSFFPQPNIYEFRNLSIDDKLNVYGHIERIKKLEGYINECENVNKKRQKYIRKYPMLEWAITTKYKGEHDMETITQGIFNDDVGYIEYLLQNSLIKKHDSDYYCSAILNPDHKIINLLLDYNIDPIMNDPSCPLYVTALKRNDIKLALRLLKKGIPLYYNDNMIDDPLLSTIKTQNKKLFLHLMTTSPKVLHQSKKSTDLQKLNNKLDINHHYGKMGITPLIYAIMNNLKNGLYMLFIENVDIDLPDYAGRTPIDYAYAYNNDLFIDLYETIKSLDFDTKYLSSLRDK